MRLLQAVYAIDGAEPWTEEIPDANVLMRWKSDAAWRVSWSSRHRRIARGIGSDPRATCAVRAERVPPDWMIKSSPPGRLMASGLVATGTVFERPEDIDRARGLLTSCSKRSAMNRVDCAMFSTQTPDLESTACWTITEAPLQPASTSTKPRSMTQYADGRARHCAKWPCRFLR